MKGVHSTAQEGCSVPTERRQRPVLVWLTLGAVSALVSMALVWAFATDALIPRRLTCAVASADGCMGWVDQARVERFKAGRAGS